MAGIVDGRKFRDAVLAQRDLVVGSEEERSAQATGESIPITSDTNTELLLSIRDTLLRIEEKLPHSNQ